MPMNGQYARSARQRENRSKTYERVGLLELTLGDGLELADTWPTSSQVVSLVRRLSRSQRTEQYYKSVDFTK